jgi:hypothetical protein
MRSDLSAGELHWQVSRFVLCSFCEGHFVQTGMSFAECLIPVQPTSQTQRVDNVLRALKIFRLRIIYNPCSIEAAVYAR